MRLIFLEGSPASGKSTLGEKLVEGYKAMGRKAVLLDHDIYIDGLFPGWFQMSQQQKESEIIKARNKHLDDINKHLLEGFVFVAIGGIWLTNDDVTKYTNNLKVKTQVFLFHLDAPLEVQKRREVQRGHNPMIDLDQWQKERDQISSWPGYIYPNVNTPEIDAINLMKLINDERGVVC